MLSDYLTCYDVILPPSLEYYVYMAIILSFIYVYTYIYNSSYMNYQNSAPQNV